MTFSIRQIGPDNITLMEDLLTTFGKAFGGTQMPRDDRLHDKPGRRP